MVLAVYMLCHPLRVGDFILSADVLEPSADVPGLKAVCYALYMYSYDYYLCPRFYRQ